MVPASEVDYHICHKSAHLPASDFDKPDKQSSLSQPMASVDRPTHSAVAAQTHLAMQAVARADPMD